MRTIWMGMMLMAAVGGGCDDGTGGGGATTGDPATEAQVAAESWLAHVDGGEYGTSWDEACAYFRGAVPKATWEAQIAGARGPLGTVVSRELISAQPATELPGAPDGEYVVLQYSTRFDAKSSSVETITPMRDADGTFRVAGYYIR